MKYCSQKKRRPVLTGRLLFQMFSRIVLTPKRVNASKIRSTSSREYLDSTSRNLSLSMSMFSCFIKCMIESIYCVRSGVFSFFFLHAITSWLVTSARAGRENNRLL